MAMKTSSVNVRMEPELKQKAEHILEILGIDPSDAVKMLYKRIVIENGWPCDLKIPNELTQRVFEETDRGVNLTTHKSVRELLGEVEKEVLEESKIARK